MHRAVLILASLLAGDVRDYARPLDAKKIDQATLDAEAFGEKKKITREDTGLRIAIAPGDAETGWKTPQQLRIGGDFTITATFVVKKLPKPAQDDGSAIGLAIASQNLDQPDETLVRVIETTGADVYRSVEKANQGQQQGMMMHPGMMMQQPGPGGKPQKPPRKTFRAKGDTVVMEFRREGQTVTYYVRDAESNAPRYLGNNQLGTNDVAGVKLFASNRNGADVLDVVLKSLMIRADRITGLGTEIRSVFGEILHGEPSAIEKETLVIGGPVKPAPQPPAVMPTLPADVFASPPGAAPAVAAAPMPAAAPAPAPAAAAPAPPPVAAPVMVAAPVAAAPAPAPPPVAAPAPAPAPAQTARKPPPALVGELPADVFAPATPPAKAEPKKIALEEIEFIAFERAQALAGRVVGQPNLDFTMPGVAENKDGKAKAAAKADDVLAPPPGTVAPVKIPKVEPKPNGIRDLHLSLSGLRPAPIKQVTINTQTDKGPTAWRLDTSDSHDWPLVLRRAGTETWADLFLEPPAGDLKGKDLTVNITYEDGQNANATIKAEQSTDPKLVFDAKRAPSLDARIHLTGGEQLFGKFDGLGEDSLRLTTPWGDHLTVPLAHVVGIYMGLPEHKEPAESFGKRLRNRGTEDLLLARSSEGEVVAIPGVAEGTDGDKLRFRFQEKSRTLPLKLVEGLVLAARPEPERPEGLRPTFSMAGGLVISGLWKDLDAKSWKIETAWGQALDLPANEIRGVHFRGGQMTYLSDVEPSKVEETPYFSRRNPWRKDVNLVGAPLRVDGQTYEHGLAVHSRSALTYELNGRYDTFESLVGFDESAKGLGRVDCRVFADDKELYANPNLHGDAPPVKLALPVSGAQRLKLVIDFGPDQDSGDRVIWANARVLRKPAPARGAVTEASPPKHGSSE